VRHSPLWHRACRFWILSHIQTSCFRLSRRHHPEHVPTISYQLPTPPIIITCCLLVSTLGQVVVAVDRQTQPSVMRTRPNLHPEKNACLRHTPATPPPTFQMKASTWLHPSSLRSIPIFMPFAAYANNSSLDCLAPNLRLVYISSTSSVVVRFLLL
jgi:hypothetical protein